MRSEALNLISAESLRKKLSKYWAILKIGYEAQAIHLGDMASLGILVALRIALLTQLYQATYASEGGTTIEGLTIAMTIWVITIAHSMQLSSGTRQIIVEISDQIRTGNIAHTMSKPYSFLLYIYSIFLGRFWIRMVSGLLFGLSAAVFLTGSIDITFWAVLASVILVLFGITLNSVICMIIGLCAFWTEEVIAFRWIYDKFQWTLSGLVIPLAFFPEGIRIFAEYSPFAMLFYPSGRILVGFETGLFLKYLALQIAWLVIFVLILNIVYRKGQKNVSINGG